MLYFAAETQTMRHFRCGVRLLIVVITGLAIATVAVLLLQSIQQMTIAVPVETSENLQIQDFIDEMTRSTPYEATAMEKKDLRFSPAATYNTLNNFPLNPTSTSDSSERRRSLVVFGADRSGTTFISRMFSQDPQVFMIYEPLWVTKRWRKTEPHQDWSRSELEVINGIISCNFPDFPMATQFLAHASRNWAAAPFKNPFQTVNFCNVSKTGKSMCPNLYLAPEFAKEACATKYKHSVTKVAQVRVPDLMLSSIVPQVFIENPDTDVKVIQILRDPRGSLDSRIKLGWMPKHTSPSFTYHVKFPCNKIAQNVKYGRNLPEKYRDKIMEIYYRDIAMSPVKTALKIYQFAGFEIPEDLIKWIILNTSPSQEALARESSRVFSSVRNSTANIEKWRRAPAEQNRIIERECHELMQLLGIEKR